jgi:hypothetical protein
MVGWKRLVRSARARLSQDLQLWRTKTEKEAITDATWLQLVDEGVAVASPLMLLALSALESEQPTLQDQRGLLDDLLNLSQWNRSGLTVVAEFPDTIAYVYQLLLGSFLVDQRRQKDAVRLLTTQVVDPLSREMSELWKSPRLMGWPKSLWGDCKKAWTYVTGLYARLPWVEHFFSTERDFVDALRAYGVLASAVELTDWLKRNASGLPSDIGMGLTVPPLFAVDSVVGSPVQRVIAKAFPDREAVTSVAEVRSVDPERIRQAWPAWAQCWAQWHTRAGDPFFSFDHFGRGGTIQLP